MGCVCAALIFLGPSARVGVPGVTLLNSVLGEGHATDVRPADCRELYASRAKNVML
jgi:hypothetical protein